VRFGAGAGLDVLDLKLVLGDLPAGFDPATQSIIVSLSDDDLVYQATIPPGTLTEVRPGRFTYGDGTGSIDGVRALRVVQRRPGRALIRLRTVPVVLDAADPVDHFAEVSIRAGDAEIEATPLWRFDGTKLVAQN
jgi:hypothetical protein